MRRLAGSQMQVRVEDLAFAEPLVFRADRLLDLDDHVGLGEDFVGRPEDRCAPAAA